MEEKIKKINTILTAFESRNELLHEEIKRNEDAIKKMEEELNQILEESQSLNLDNKGKTGMAL